MYLEKATNLLYSDVLSNRLHTMLYICSCLYGLVSLCKSYLRLYFARVLHHVMSVAGYALCPASSLHGGEPGQSTNGDNSSFI